MSKGIVIITGANSGIGKAATIRFAQEGYTVVMACRNLEKSKIVQQGIKQLTKNNNIDLLKLDVSSFDSIRQFCWDFKNKYYKLDILIHNAGYFNHSERNYQLSSDNIQLSFATNTVGPFLITHLLKDMFAKSDDARILNACTTNIRHFFNPKRKIEFDNLQGEKKDTRSYNSYKFYGDSKMALLMLTVKMADLLKKDGIKINAVQIPAIKISKETRKQLKSIWRLAASLQYIFSDTPQSMADTYFDICTSSKFKNITGKLINDKREIVKTSHYDNGLVQEIKQLFDKSVYPKYADDIETIEKVWGFCKNATGLNI